MENKADVSTKARTFKQLKKEVTLEHLNEFAKNVTESYACSSAGYSQTNLAQDNNLSKKCARDLMDYAIMTNLVSLEIAGKVLEKSIFNQREKEGMVQSSSITHHKKLIAERVKFIAFSYQAAQIEKIATDIAKNPQMSLPYFTCKYGLESKKVTNFILQRAIAENIVSDEIMEMIIARSIRDLQGRKKEVANMYFEHLKTTRKQKKED